MTRERRARRDLIIALIGVAVVLGLTAAGVAAVNRFPYLYENFIAWRWRILLGMAMLPLAVLLIAYVVFAILAWLMRRYDSGSIS